MVVLLVKGTRERDDFSINVPGTTLVKDIVPVIQEMQNTRIRIHHQIYSARELIESFNDKMDVTPLRAVLEEAEKGIMAKAVKPEPSTPGDTQRIWRAFRDATVTLWPLDCTHTDGEDAAVSALYKKHDDPELDETQRLHVFHWRAILDREYRSHEGIEGKAVMWFAGKLMDADAPLSQYLGKNEKSTATVKITAEAATAPMREPRVPYDTQRALANHAKQRAAEFKTLEDSEVREYVLKQTKGNVLLPGGRGGDGVGGTGEVRLSASNVNTICPKQTETEVVIPT
eukprot:PhF_6_TR28322/c0_g1_i1/m.41960